MSAVLLSCSRSVCPCECWEYVASVGHGNAGISGQDSFESNGSSCLIMLRVTSASDIDAELHSGTLFRYSGVCLWVQLASSLSR